MDEVRKLALSTALQVKHLDVAELLANADAIEGYLRKGFPEIGAKYDDWGIRIDERLKPGEVFWVKPGETFEQAMKRMGDKAHDCHAECNCIRSAVDRTC